MWMMGAKFRLYSQVKRNLFSLRRFLRNSKLSNHIKLRQFKPHFTLIYKETYVN